MLLLIFQEKKNKKENKQKNPPAASLPASHTYVKKPNQTEPKF